MDLPPSVPPAIHAPAAECRIATQAEAQAAFATLRRALPGTAWDAAGPSQICGLVQVRMQSGKVAYTDLTGRYMLLAFALDTKSGEPADLDAKLQQQIYDRETFPSESIPNVYKSVE